MITTEVKRSRPVGQVASRVALRAFCTVAIGVMLMLSATFAVTFPQRISVLPSLQVDAQAYDAIALDLSHRWTLDAIPPLQPPGFVAYLAAVFAVFGHSWTVARLSLWVCLALITVLAALTARALYGREAAAWSAALLCAGSPALRAYTGTLQYELLVALALLALAWLTHLVPALGRSRARLAAAALLGLALGLVVLIREVIVVVIPLAAVYLLSRRVSPRSTHGALAAAVLCLTCAAGPPLAWSALQSTRAGRPVTISDKGPLVLAFGNNPLANGTFNAPLVGVAEPSGLQFIRERPRDAAWLAVRKCLYFWGILRDGWNVPRPSAFLVARSLGGTVPLEKILPWSRGGWLLVAFLIALALWRRETWKAWWHVPAIVTGIMLVHVLTVSSYRFAIPVLPLVFVAVAGPLAWLGVKLYKHRWPRAIVILAVFVVALMQWGRWPLEYELSAGELDGFRAENRLDEDTGAVVRFADPAGGRRPVLLLGDEYFPAGPVTLNLSARVIGGSVASAREIFRIWIANLDGEVLCERTATAGELASATQQVVTVRCRIPSGGPVVVAVETLGVVPLAFGELRFTWP